MRRRLGYVTLRQAKLLLLRQCTLVQKVKWITEAQQNFQK